MPFIVEMLKVNCTGCNQPVWALIRSQEEHAAFKCAACSNFLEYLENQDSDRRD